MATASDCVVSDVPGSEKIETLLVQHMVLKS